MPKHICVVCLHLFSFAIWVLHVDAPVCIRMHSYAAATHPYASVCLHTLPLRIKMSIFNTPFPAKSKQTQ